jgi:hypothetical protein
MKYLKLFAALLVMAACGQTTQNNTDSAPAPAQASKAPAQLPTLPQALVDDLVNNTEKVDYIFYDLPFSISTNTKEDSRAHLTHIDVKPATISNACQPFGRIFYNSGEGKGIVEAEVFFSKECQYFVFWVDKKPAYANAMSPAGITFLNNLLSKLKSPQQPEDH